MLDASIKSLIALLLSVALLSCGESTVHTTNNTTGNADVGADTADLGLDADSDAADTDLVDAGDATDGDAGSQTCINGDTSSCTAPDDSHAVGCVLGKCVFECDQGYADDDEDLGVPNGNGCESDCIPTNGGDEICDGVDNDCDGETDEGYDVFTECSAGVGACATAGQRVCGADQQSTECDAVAGDPAAEVCDGIDNDCDSDIDEDDPQAGTSCETGDDGVCNAGSLTCNQGALECVATEGPSSEICDGLDNDCDGEADQGNPEGGASCDTGQDGICATGTEQCNGGAIECVPDETPQTESCGPDGSGDGVDNDCNGETDEGCTCSDGATKSCYNGPSGTDGVGACQAGTLTCTNGTWSSCQGEVTPTTEACNGVDDNCDGTADEGVKNTYYPDSDGDGFGDPTSATQACSAPSGHVGNDQDCDDTDAAVNPNGSESCNGTDDNCDGNVDENLTRTCGSDVGACQQGTETCSSGAWGACQNSVGPSSETCNDIDDNCNGNVDEDLTRTCGTDVGTCQEGTETCSSGQWGSCVGNSAPVTELCANSADDDCDGTTDEASCEVCTDGETRPCGSDEGACQRGTETCSSGQWGSCSGQTGPVTETCNSIDDDCDGNVDNGVKTTYYADDDGDGFGDPSSTQRTCSAPNGYVTNGNDCDDGDASISPNAAEMCNGVDDNCDGTADEGNPGGGASCSTGQPGVCSSGTTACVSGSIECQQDSQPSSETCDGLDNDCDGNVDDGVQTTYYADGDGDGYGGNNSTRACSLPSGHVGNSDDCDDSDPSINPAASESCNGVDDDCDNSTDETFSNKGSSCSVGSGTCRNTGSYVCTADGSATECSAAAGSPNTEVCDGIDNDCDGSVDENLTRSCGTNTGQCSTGTESCSNGSWGTCQGDTGSSNEVCDGLDNDCDGSVDENLTRSCGTNTGQCSTGTESCSNGSWGTCQGDTGSSNEVCDGLDNDCDGSVDENLTRSCGTNTGQCSTGTESCSNGSWGVCQGETSPTTEVCDGLDNDCDGSVDDGVSRSCGSSTGQCTTGTQYCSSGSWGTCQGDTGPSNEVCDGIDNDCDNTVDEGVSRSCGSSTGQCSTGTQYCSAGSWGSCQGDTGSSPEVCDGLDNDCDGSTDEGVQNTYYHDGDGDGYGDPFDSTTACSTPTDHVSNNNDCDDTDSYTHPGAAEACFNSSADRDCDGLSGCRDSDCDGAGCRTSGGQFGTCTNGYCASSTSGCSSDYDCGYNESCQFCSGGNNVCCPDGQLCPCRIR